MADEAASASKAQKKPSKFSWRAYNRAIHRDLGHVAVGLTVVYALSGIAVNHIKEWEPNFESYQLSIELGGPIAGSDEEAAKTAMARLGVKDAPRDVYRAAPDDLQIILDNRTLHVNTVNGHVLDEGQRPRFFLRVANWLHLNRGKKAWTLIADLYAVGLLLLALSGILMLPGRKGLVGRGGILILVGAAVPILYVQLSGGPDLKSGQREAPVSSPPDSAP
jgi:uncharacterized protein